jgi:hypothetical protein
MMIPTLYHNFITNVNRLQLQKHCTGDKNSAIYHICSMLLELNESVWKFTTLFPVESSIL